MRVRNGSCEGLIQARPTVGLREVRYAALSPAFSCLVCVYESSPRAQRSTLGSAKETARPSAFPSPLSALGPVPSTSWHLPDTCLGPSRSRGTREHGHQSMVALEDLRGLARASPFPKPCFGVLSPVPPGLCTCHSHLPAWLPPTHNTSSWKPSETRLLLGLDLVPSLGTHGSCPCPNTDLATFLHFCYFFS